MKILSVNQTDTVGGAARAAHRVAAQLVAMDVDLRMLVMRKLGADPWVSGSRNLFESFLSRLLPRLDMMAAKQAGVKTGNPWSLNRFQNPMLNETFINSFDVIHLHWVGKNMLPLSWMRNFKKPVVWTLHDGWPFTGGCHLPDDCRRFETNCGRCPQLSHGSEHDASRRLWFEKKEAYASRAFHFIAPSRWMAEEAKASSLLKNLPVSVIPNGLDTRVFAPVEKAEARNALSLPRDKSVILFGAMRAFADKRKGLDLLIEALARLKARNSDFAEHTILAMFGVENQPPPKAFPIPVIQLGIIKNDGQLARIYSAADLTVVPSLMESFGQVASESLSCGTPVVAFNATGLKNVVDSMVTGYLADPFQIEDLANGIEMLLRQPDTLRKMSLNARQQALERFDIGVTAKMHLDLFEELTGTRK